MIAMLLLYVQYQRNFLSKVLKFGKVIVSS